MIFAEDIASQDVVAIVIALCTAITISITVITVACYKHYRKVQQSAHELKLRKLEIEKQHYIDEQLGLTPPRERSKASQKKAGS